MLKKVKVCGCSQLWYWRSCRRACRPAAALWQVAATMCHASPSGWSSCFFSSKSSAGKYSRMEEQQYERRRFDESQQHDAAYMIKNKTFVKMLLVLHNTDTLEIAVMARHGTVSRPPASEKTADVQDITALHTPPYHMSYLPMSLAHIIPCPASDSCEGI